MDQQSLPTFVYLIIEAVIFILPVLTLVWKASALASRVSQNEKEIEEINKRLDQQNNLMVANTTSLIESMHNLEVEIAKMSAQLEDLRAQFAKK